MSTVYKEKGASYIVWTDAGRTFVQEGDRGAIVHDGDDAATEINWAFNQLNILGGGNLHVKRGSYTITSPITQPPYTDFTGDGKDTLLTLGAANTLLNTISGQANWAMRIANMRFDGDGNANRLISWLGVKQSIIENCEFHNCEADMIYHGDTGGDYGVYCIFMNNFFRNDTGSTMGAGMAALRSRGDNFIISNIFDIGGAGTINNAIKTWAAGDIIIGNHISHITDSAIEAGGGSMIMGNFIDQCVGYGVRLGGKTNTIINGNRFYHNPSAIGWFCIEIAGVGGGHIITDNKFSTTQTLNWYIHTGTSTSGCLIKDNLFDVTNIAISYLMDEGVDTRLQVARFQFSEGGNAAGIQTAQFIHADGSAKGWEVDTDAEWAIAMGVMPPECQRSIRMRIWGVGLAAPPGGGVSGMAIELLVNTGVGDEVYTAEVISIVSGSSDQLNFGVNDVVSWTFDSSDDTDIDDLVAGDCIEVKVKHETCIGAKNISTDAVFRCVEIEYV